MLAVAECGVEDSDIVGVGNPVGDVLRTAAIGGKNGGGVWRLRTTNDAHGFRCASGLEGRMMRIGSGLGGQREMEENGGLLVLGDGSGCGREKRITKRCSRHWRSRGGHREGRNRNLGFGRDTKIGRGLAVFNVLVLR